MYDETHFIRVPQDAPKWKRTHLHDWIRRRICEDGECSVSDIIRQSGMREKQCREAMADLWRAGFLMRRKVQSLTCWMYVYVEAGEDQDGYSRWEPGGQHRAVLGAVTHFGYRSIRDIWQAPSVGLSHDQTKRIVEELWRAGHFRRRRAGVGSHWYYEYIRIGQ